MTKITKTHSIRHSLDTLRVQQKKTKHIYSYRAEFRCLTTLTVILKLSSEIDHCADGTHGCEQEFMNTEDACACKCRQGFTLRPDGKTCESKSVRSLPISLLKLGLQESAEKKKNYTNLISFIHFCIGLCLFRSVCMVRHNKKHNVIASVQLTLMKIKCETSNYNITLE